ncbi:MAG: sugar phosphate isomerase/epimerase [Spirochaetales bacterium]|nr:sugar phosphate isomerase/epimerase [Spirochaetales bacterium]
MTLGFVSAVVADLGFEDTIDLAADYGFDCVEILCWPPGKAERRYAGVTHIDVTDLTDEHCKKIQDYLKKKGVYISGLGYYPNYLDADREQGKFFVDHFKKVIAAAAKLGIPVANTFIGRDPAKNIEDNFDLFRKVWPGIVSFAEDKKVKIGIENCPMFFTRDEWPGGKNLAISPAVWRRMFEEIPSKNFGLNYDPSHMVWQHMDHIKPIYEFANRIFHVHIKDVKIMKDKLDDVGIMATPLEYHAPKLPGLGDVEWGKFFSALTDIRYQGAACIEVEDRAYEDSLDARKGSLLQSRNFVHQFLPRV